MSDGPAVADRGPVELARPAPPRTLVDRVLAWLAWFGFGRLAATGVATLAVAGGAWWLVRTPPPPTEAMLPITAGAAGGRTSTTLATAGETGAANGTPAPTTPSAPAHVIVHVAGAVAEPGVHELRAGARVVDAIAAAGGVLSDGAPDVLNLAAIVTDAQRIYVPRVGEEVPATVPPATVGAIVPVGPVDLNRATVDELDTLPGIGPTTAAAIVEHRERSGPFATVDDLLDVRGIGPAKLDAIRELVSV